MKSKYWHIGVILISIILLITLILILINIRPLTLSGISMLPYYYPNQTIYYAPYAYALPLLFQNSNPIYWKKPQINDIIILQEDETNRLLIKRIIANDTTLWSIQNNYLQIGFCQIPLTPKQKEKILHLKAIPENYFFVIGDNYDESRDSRDFGPIPLDHIKGKVLTRPKELK